MSDWVYDLMIRVKLDDNKKYYFIREAFGDRGDALDAIPQSIESILRTSFVFRTIRPEAIDKLEIDYYENYGGRIAAVAVNPASTA